MPLLEVLVNGGEVILNQRIGFVRKHRETRNPSRDVSFLGQLLGNDISRS